MAFRTPSTNPVLINTMRMALGIDVLDNRENVIEAEVTEFDEEDMTIIVQPIDEAQAPYVVPLIMPDNRGGYGCIEIPKIGSRVLILRVDEHHAAYLRGSELESYIIKTPGGIVEVHDTGEVVVNEGSHGGVVKVAELVGRLNAIESSLKLALGGAALAYGVAGDSAHAAECETAAKAPDTTITDIENESFRH